ncbi:MarR family transcriptional regulator [Candidatus Woesearchaeota archaeon]|nr:MarR family transcriptional regulator [Candidatus Woesearchaeota archaeon]
MEKELIKGISLVKSSEYRSKILKSIGKQIRMPSEIANDTALRLNHVSMFLKEMVQHNLIICLNENDRKGRLYKITELGKNVLKRCQ